MKMYATGNVRFEQGWRLNWFDHSIYRKHVILCIGSLCFFRYIKLPIRAMLERLYCSLLNRTYNNLFVSCMSCSMKARCDMHWLKMFVNGIIVRFNRIHLVIVPTSSYLDNNLFIGLVYSCRSAKGHMYILLR